MCRFPAVQGIITPTPCIAQKYIYFILFLLVKCYDHFDSYCHYYSRIGLKMAAHPLDG